MNPILLGPMLPELLLAGLALAVLMVDLFLRPERKQWAGLLSAAGLAAVLVLLLEMSAGGERVFFGALLLDSTALFFRRFFVVAALLVTVITFTSMERFDRGKGEFFSLVLLATLGMMLLGAVNDFLSLFICMETMTVCFYIMAAYERRRLRSSEAGLKYLILGALSTGFLLNGVSFIYGATGEVHFERIQEVLAGPALDHEHTVLLRTGILLLIVGLGFKIGAVPFHVWVPDVYQGAPTPTTAFLAVGSKAAGFAMITRIFGQALWEARSFWGPVLLVLAVVTIAYGNLAAIPQINIKRLMGYSSIGHSGYMLLGVAAVAMVGTEATRFDGFAALFYYLLAYLFSNVVVFVVIAAVERSENSSELEDYAGLARRSPILGLALFVGLLSLAGVPPLAGFFGKFMVLAAAYEQGLLWAFFIGVGFVAVSLYYYLCVLKRAYIFEPKSITRITPHQPARLVILVCVALVIILGVVQRPFVRSSDGAASALASYRPAATTPAVKEPPGVARAGGQEGFRQGAQSP